METSSSWPLLAAWQPQGPALGHVAPKGSSYQSSLLIFGHDDDDSLDDCYYPVFFFRHFCNTDKTSGVLGGSPSIIRRRELSGFYHPATKPVHLDSAKVAMNADGI